MACDTLCRAPESKTHGKDEIFAVRLGEKRVAKSPLCVRRGAKRTAINGTFAMRLYKRTTKALFLLLVLVTLSCVFRKTHGKVTIAILFVSTFKNT
jgi:hypothetical protein